MADKVKCIIVAGAPDNDLDFIKENITSDCFVIAADSGYKKLEKIGIKPDIIVADFDSSKKPEYSVDIEVYPIEKDATDTFNSVKLAIDKGFKDITVLGALGGRADHTYSNILCLDYVKKHGANCVLLSPNNRISLITEYKKIKKDHSWFSVFAFLEKCEGVRINGAHYSQEFFNKESLHFDLGDQFGQSNYIENEYCEITVEKGTLLLIESNDIK